MVLATAAALGASALLAIAPPPKPGPWHQIGAAVTSKPGKLAHFFRTAQNPTMLAVVARSSSAKPIRLTWFTYCEFESDDAMTEEHQGVVTGVHVASVYPSVLDGATLCTVSVTVRVAGGRASAAVFDY
jgi:hypothetical protein